MLTPVATPAARLACRLRWDTMKLDDVRRVVGALERAGVRYAVFGAIAMAAHGLDRATRDLDLFVARPRDRDDAERLRRAFDMGD